MLAAGGVDLEKAFLNSTLITTVGIDSSTAGTVTLDTDTYLSEANTSYYIFCYYNTYFVIYKHLNGILTEIYRYGSSYLYIDTEYANGYTLFVGSDHTKYSFGMFVLTFDFPMDNILSRFNNGVSYGDDDDSFSYDYGYYSDVAEENSIRYIFACVGNTFCIYKSTGLTYSDLTLLCNSGITLTNYNTERFRIGSSYTNGYTLLSVRG
jgi:hypothetical protein